MIDTNGVHAYAEGDPVPAGAVENLGLVVGEDVTPSGLSLLPKPTKNAKRSDWAAYALDQGVAADEVDALTRDQLAARFDEENRGVPAEEA